MIDKSKAKNHIPIIDFDKIYLIQYTDKYRPLFRAASPFRNKIFFSKSIFSCETLSKKDITEIDYLVNQAVFEYNNRTAIKRYNEFITNFPAKKSETELKDFKIDLSKYYGQYMTGIIDGEIYIYANFIYKTYKELLFKNKFVDVDGGGKDFFRLFINLNDFGHYGLEVNSPM